MTNSKQTKRALFSSVVALLLCFTMLLGTTFAWFTDSASTSVNKIQAGTLDIQLLDANGNSLEGKTLAWQKAAGHENEEVLWEPGCTYNLQTITIKNNGNLALEYKIEITGINGDAELNEAIEWTITNSNTVSDLGADHSLAVGASDTLTISGHMKEDAGNEYQGLSIDGIAITVLATQDTVEYDSYDNQYDKDATYTVDVWDGTSSSTPTADADGVYHISTAAELIGMMSETGNSIYSGKTIVLDENIDLAGQTVKGIGGISTNFDGVFDGQGYTISKFKIESDSDYYAGLFNQVTHGGTIKNLTVKNATIVGKSMVGAIASSVDSGATIDNCKAIDCTLIGVKKVGAVVGYSAGSTVTNNYAKNCSVYYSEKEGAEVLGYENTGSTVNGNSFNNVSVMNANVISDASDLAALSAKAVSGTYVLLNDIDMSNANFSAIIVPRSSSLTFIGGGHKISNVNVVSGSGDNTTGQASMFYAFPSSTLNVSNLTLENVVATADANDSGYAAAVVGYCEGAVTLEDVDVVNAKVVGVKSSGMLVGHLSGSLVANDCDLSGTVTLSTYSEEANGHYAGKYIGTLAGTATLKNCTADVTVSGNLNDSNIGTVYGRVTSAGSLTEN